MTYRVVDGEGMARHLHHYSITHTVYVWLSTPSLLSGTNSVTNIIYSPFILNGKELGTRNDF